MKKVIVGMATCGMSAGATATYDKLKELVAADNAIAELDITGCIGMCYREPLVEVRDGDKLEGRVIYGGVTPEIAEEIFEKHLKGGEILSEHVVIQGGGDETLSGEEAQDHAEHHQPGEGVKRLAEDAQHR